MLRHRAVVFDFDLTLVDSSAGFSTPATLRRRALRPAAARRRGRPAHDRHAAAHRRSHVSTAALSRRRGVHPPLPGARRRGDDGLTVMLPGAVETPSAPSRPPACRSRIVSQKLRYRVEDVLAARRPARLPSPSSSAARTCPPSSPTRAASSSPSSASASARPTALYVGDTDDRRARRRATPACPSSRVLTGVHVRDAFAPYAPLAVLPQRSSACRRLSCDATVPATPEQA